ncbi:hypothetical protein LWI29_021767 [Acer saccharum]|uniref:Uncharacterized protein n=1 Tax=Acer saccharum TaxID=4024 RepID=A0AA39T4U6_ACESA|nr:hypothetical protein LWI29_021767 [Acer saccharum]
MPQKYFSLVIVLEELDKVFTLEDLQGTLKAYEAKINLLNPQPRQPDQALKFEVLSSRGRGSYNNRGRSGNFRGRGGNSRGRGRNFSGNNYSSNNQHESNQNSGNNNNGNNHHGGNRNRNFNSQQRGRGRGFQRSRGRGYFECHFCHKLGHVISDCWHKQAEDKKNDAVLIHENSEENLLLACYGDDIDEVWYLDSGASKHMTSNKNLLSNLSMMNHGQCHDTNHHCMRGDKFQWPQEVEDAFQLIKDRLTSALILVLLDFSQPFELHSDASKVGIGVVLSQANRLVAFFSEKLSGARERYNTYDIEFYVVVQAIKHW